MHMTSCLEPSSSLGDEPGVRRNRMKYEKSNNKNQEQGERRFDFFIPPCLFGQIIVNTLMSPNDHKLVSNMSF